MEASPSVTGLVPNERSSLGSQSDTIRALRDLLVTAGWVFDGGSSPKATLVVVVNIESLPVRSPDPPGGDADKIPGSVLCTGAPAIRVTTPGEEEPSQVWGWDPGLYTEPPCTHFAYGFTKGNTYEAFKNALSTALGMGISTEISLGSGVVELHFQAPAAGPGKNGTQVTGWVNGTVWYGGWRVNSGVYRGRKIGLSAAEGPGFGGGSWSALEITVSLWLDPFDLEGTPQHKFALGLSGRWEGGSTPPQPYSRIGEVPVTGDPNANTGDWSWFRLVACPYQMAMWFDGSTDGPIQQGSGPRSIFISMPWVPDGFSGHTSFVFGSNTILENFRNQMEWPAMTQFNGDEWQETGVVIPCMRVRNAGTVNTADRVTNTQGAVLIENAYVCSHPQPTNYIGDHRICGKLWNCAVLDQNYPAATITATMQDATWLHVGSHAWAFDYSTLPGRGIYYGAEAASVWWKLDSPAASRRAE